MCFLYYFIENWFLKGCPSINTPFIEIAFRLQYMFIFIITSIYETIQAPAPTTCIHRLVKWFVELKKPHSTSVPLIFLFVRTLLLSLLHKSMLTPVIDATEKLGIHVKFTPFFKYHTGTFPLLWYILLKIIYF